VRRLLAIALLAACLRSQAQVNSLPPENPQPASVATNALTLGLSSIIPTNAVKLGGDVVLAVSDSVPYFMAGTERVGVAALYSNHKTGFLVDLIHPVVSVNTNGQVSIGFAAAYLDHTFYDASVGLNLGMTAHVPVLGAVYLFGESGPGFQFKDSHAVAQSFIGVSKSFTLFHKLPLSIKGGLGNISDRPGPAFVLGLDAQMKF